MQLSHDCLNNFAAQQFAFLRWFVITWWQATRAVQIANGHLAEGDKSDLQRKWHF